MSDDWEKRFRDLANAVSILRQTNVPLVVEYARQHPKARNPVARSYALIRDVLGDDDPLLELFSETTLEEPLRLFGEWPEGDND